MAAYNKFNCFVEDVAKRVHKLDTSGNGGDQLVVALLAAANAPVATNTVLANLTQISYANLSSRNLVISASAQAGGTYKLTVTDLVLTASGSVGPFRYVVIYNDTPTSPADPLIAWYDYGSEITLQNAGETFTIDLDDSNGVLTIV